jgi:lipid A 3-O-deacylase
MLVAVLLVPRAAWAVDGVALEGGYGDEDAIRGGAAAVWDWNVQWLRLGNWSLGGQWELSASYWDGDEGCTGNDSLAEIGITPVFRYGTDTPLLGTYPFLEAAVGAHFLSQTELGDRRFGINYTFGDHVGAGFRFGTNRKFELVYRHQHLSNASISRHNDGIDFDLLRVGYRF